jgi:hypothetical protein
MKKDKREIDRTNLTDYVPGKPITIKKIDQRFKRNNKDNTWIVKNGHKLAILGYLITIILL